MSKEKVKRQLATPRFGRIDAALSEVE